MGSYKVQELLWAMSFPYKRSKVHTRKIIDFLDCFIVKKELDDCYMTLLNMSYCQIMYTYK